MKEYPDVFERNLGKFPGKVHLEVDPDISPVTNSLPRRIPTALKEKFKEELQRLEDLKVIVPVDKPTPWVSSVVHLKEVTVYGEPGSVYSGLACQPRSRR